MRRDQSRLTSLKQYVDEVMLAREESDQAGSLLDLEKRKTSCGGLRCGGVALLLENKDQFAGKTVAVVISGGNIDRYLFDGIVAGEE